MKTSISFLIYCCSQLGARLSLHLGSMTQALLYYQICKFDIRRQWLANENHVAAESILLKVGKYRTQDTKYEPRTEGKAGKLNRRQIHYSGLQSQEIRTSFQNSRLWVWKITYNQENVKLVFSGLYLFQFNGLYLVYIKIVLRNAAVFKDGSGFFTVNTNFRAYSLAVQIHTSLNLWYSCHAWLWFLLPTQDYMNQLMLFLLKEQWVKRNWFGLSSDIAIFPLTTKRKI